MSNFSLTRFNNFTFFCARSSMILYIHFQVDLLFCGKGLQKLNFKTWRIIYFSMNYSVHEKWRITYFSEIVHEKEI